MRLGRWELMRPLGRGGMGEVWLARDIASGEEVAIKRLLSAFEGDALLRFQRESRTLIGLRNPGVVAWRDAGRDESARPWIALELVSGGTLEELVAKEGPLPLSEAVCLAIDLCRALAAVHAAGVLHRDLKPGNVLLDEAGRPKITDFGLARPIARGQSLTESGTIMGSPGFMAPEQVTGAKDELGPETDVYGLGAILFHLLTGRAPFEGGTVVACLEKILREPAPAPSRIRSQVRGPLDVVVRRCLAKAPGERYPSARALEVALEACLPERRRSRLPLVLLASAGTLAIAVGLTLSSRSRPTTVTVTDPAALASACFERGQARQAQGDAGAIEEYTRALAHDPRHVESLRRRGEAWRDQGDLSRAIEDWSLAIQIAPTAELHAERGRARRDRGLSDAIADFERAIALDPSLADAWIGRGEERHARGEYAEASADATRALELAPWRARAWKNRAVARLALGDRWGARSDFDQALVVDPADAECWMNRGVARGMSGDRRGAIEDLTRAIAILPGSAAFRDRGVTRFQLGESAAAIADLSAAVRLDPQDATALMFRSQAHVSRGDLEEAIADLERILALLPPEDERAAQVRGDLEALQTAQARRR